MKKKHKAGKRLKRFKYQLASEPIKGTLIIEITTPSGRNIKMVEA